ncbi:MAG: hypothetical protein ACRCZ0_12550 [Cetobacterium sp.]
MFITIIQENEKFKRVHEINLFDIISVEKMTDKEKIKDYYILQIREKRKMRISLEDYDKLIKFIRNK